MAFGFGFGMPRSFATPFSPASLFATGAPGTWYDPSDRTTLFQDSAGTTPVTAVEQPVGLMLDKSQGLVLGPQLVTNGTFETNITGWVVGNAGQSTLAWSDGKLRITRVNAGDTYPNARTTLTGLTVGRIYKIVSATNNPFGIEAYHSIAGIVSSTVRTTLASKTLECVFAATATSHNLDVGIWATSGSAGQYVEFDNISVRELPGNHAFQSTAASRPVLSARYNLLTKTEQFDDAGVWSTTSGVTFSSGVAAFATSSYRYQTYTHGTSIAGLAFTARVKLHSPTGKATIVLRVSGVSTPSDDAVLVVNLTSTPTVYTLTRTFTSTNTGIFVGLDNRPSESGDGIAGDVVATEWSIVPANQSTLPYQRVNTATDYNTVGFLPFLKFDGVDDSLSTNSINFTSTDKMSVFAGVRKLSDAAAGSVFVELSVESGANAGSFGMFAPVTSTINYGWRSRGTASFLPLQSSGYIPPITNTLTGLGDISGDLATLRVNGAQVAQSTADQGTGNYGNYPLFIGRRGGSSLPFNGQLYSMIIVGKAVTAGELTSSEAYVNQKTGAY